MEVIALVSFGFGFMFSSLQWSGVDVMIKIFCDFSQFSAKKLAFFSKTNVMINFFQNLALFWVKNAKFLLNFLAKIFKKS
jgi:hypothetical protein